MAYSYGETHQISDFVFDPTKVEEEEAKKQLEPRNLGSHKFVPFTWASNRSIHELINSTHNAEMDSSTAAAVAANAMLGITPSTGRSRKSSITLSTVFSTVLDVVVFLSVSLGYILQVRT